MNLSNVFSDGMVLQRAPAVPIVWGFASPGIRVETTFGAHSLSALTDHSGVWRQPLPPTEASDRGQTLLFRSSEGGAALRDVLFGEVYLCSGQSNMEYTPRSMAGMNNASAEIAAADSPAYRSVRLFTVGKGTTSKTPLRALGSLNHGPTACSFKPIMLNPFRHTFRASENQLPSTAPQAPVDRSR